MKYLVLFFLILAFNAYFSSAETDFKEILDILDLKPSLELVNSDLKENKCYEDLERYFKDLVKGKAWATKMFDASEKLSSGIMGGKRILIGNFELCLKIESPYDFNGQYCLLSLNFTKPVINSPSFPNLRPPEYLIGKCVPSSCTREYLNQVIDHIHIPFSDKNLSEFMDLNISPGNCQIKNQETSFTALNYFTISVFALLIIFVVLSTTYDFVYQKTFQKEMTIATAFSLIRNGRPLFYRTENGNGISGLRVILALNTIIPHYIHTVTNTIESNMAAVEVTLNKNKVGFAIIGNAHMFVDMFLVLGAIIAMRSFLNEINKRKSYNPVFAVIKRYFRVMVPAALIILIRIGIAEHLHSGPIYNELQRFFSRNCMSTLASTFFVYDNFKSEMFNMCYEHLWYIHVDLQLFLFIQLIFLFGIWKPKALPKFTLFLCIAVSLFEFYIAIKYNLSHSPYCDPNHVNLKFHYHLPHTRAATTVLGLFFGYLLFKNENRHIPKKVKSLLWISGVLIIGLSAHISYYMECPDYVQPISALVVVYRKLLFSIGACFIICSCFIQKDDLLSKLMLIPPLPLLGEISYEIYVIHLPVIHFHLMSARENLFASFWRTIASSMNIFFVSAFLAIFMNLMITRPTLILVQYLKNFCDFGTIRTTRENKWA